MFKRKTVFIIGAGTSAEFNLPVGSRLAELVCTKMDVRFEPGTQPVGSGDFSLYANLSEAMSTKRRELQAAFWRIRNGILFSNSIDDFLDRHQIDELMQIAGKGAIVKTIIEEERRSKLMPDERTANFDVLNVKDTWLLKLVRMMGAGVDAEQIFENVSFISFNYDRCLQHFLRQAIRDLYAISEPKFFQLLAGLKIFHPYGVVGPLVAPGIIDGISFGGTRDGLNYLDLGKHIFTYTEQVRDKKDIAGMQQILAEAEQLVFLGFGFHAQNMQLLLEASGSMPKKQVYATVHETSRANAEVVADRILALFHSGIREGIRGQIRFSENGAGRFMDEYRLPLTA